MRRKVVVSNGSIIDPETKEILATSQSAEHADFIAECINALIEIHRALKKYPDGTKWASVTVWRDHFLQLFKGRLQSI